MASNFFSQQDLARRNTRILVSLFSLAVVLLLVLTNILVLVGLGMVDLNSVNEAASIQQGLPWSVIAFTSIAVITAVAIAVLIKWQQLQGGGKVVATSLGGSRVDAASSDPLERRLLNVVEEMAIAANVPVPPVYLLPERGINAFAAGYSAGDAVIGVTRGCIEQLDRDELQGVVAHEFSHILNGDMRMNIRMIAILNGILFLGHVGYYMLRAGGRSRSIGRSSNSKNKNAGGIVAIALGLVVIGYLGSFFGNLIKAAVSRQREYLADASAVQFSRNPRGIAGALKRIGAYSTGTRIKNQNADEHSHLFFGEAIARWASIFATHPPLAKRIKRLEPHWNGKFPSPISQVELTPEAAENQQAAQTPANNGSAMPDRQQVMQAMATLPLLLVQSSRKPLQAQAIVCAVLLQHPDYEARQIAIIKEQGSLTLLQQTDQLVDVVQSLTAPLQVQLLQRTIPALKQLSFSQFQQFEQLIQALIKIDEQVSLLEWIVINFIDHTVASHFQPKPEIRGPRQNDVTALQTPILQLLSAVASEAGEPQACQQAWQAGLTSLGLDSNISRPKFEWSALAAQLGQLLTAAPLVKQSIWQAILATVAADQQQNDAEEALLAALALLLEMPWQPEQPAIS